MCCRTRMNVYNQNPLIDYYPLFALLSNNNSSCGCNNCGCCSYCGCNDCGCHDCCCGDWDSDRDSGCGCA